MDENKKSELISSSIIEILNQNNKIEIMKIKEMMKQKSKNDLFHHFFYLGLFASLSAVDGYYLITQNQPQNEWIYGVSL